ncbi:MAG: hypothetical protein HFI86_01615 [Bacilli bacterium]|nr:hypothetical protein [Bacilli bacterium]
MVNDKMYLEKHLNEFVEQIEKNCSNIIDNDKSPEAFASVNSMYKYLKDLADNFYNKETATMHRIYIKLLWIVNTFRNKISDELYIIPTNELYKYDGNFHYSYNINNTEETNILNLIVHETYNAYQLCRGIYPKNFETYDLSNSCYIISTLVQTLCKKRQIKCQTIKMEAGFSNKYPLFDGYRYHYFNISEINNKQYLIDCSYKQFFLANENMIECLGIPFFDLPLAGIYMMMDKKRANVAKEILKNGYILITPDNLKHYLDGFTLSFRNGLYYEENIDATYTTPYTYNQYLEFLYTDASLLDYEDKELLGYQKRPLRNSNFIFKAK